jgi:HIP---CoA ligase
LRGKKIILNGGRRLRTRLLVSPPTELAWPSIPALLSGAEAQFGHQIALRDGDLSLSYAELGRAARQFGAALAVSGVEAGDRVSIWAPNGVEWVVAALGIFAAGAVLVPVNTRFK